MDSIDIIDPQFSLGMPDSLIIPDSLNIPDLDGNIFLDNPIDSKILGGGSSSSSMKTDYTMLIYIGTAIFLGLIGMVVYKKYITMKNKRENAENYVNDCADGFCPVVNPNKTY